MAIGLTESIDKTYVPKTVSGRNPYIGLVSLLFVATLSFLALYSGRSPAAAPASAPSPEFSSERAMKHLQIIGRKPHPIGSAEHGVVRDYILDQLRGLGLSPEVQKAAIVSQPDSMPVIAGTTENIIARIKGADNTKAVMITGHYDSVSTGPGASDDGSAVATMLETARALKSWQSLKNDVVLLFTDGEEAGLLGATAFVSEHPAAREVGVAFNFEARGSSGPSMMFETSNGNRRLIGEFSKAVPHPVTNSLMYEVYKLLPNDTDFSVFKKAGMAGFNFAFIGESTHYHTQLDSADTIAESSLQHQGSYAIALTRHFGNLDLRATSEGNAVYFDVLGAFVAHYSTSLVAPLTVLILLTTVMVALLGYKKRQLTFSGMALGSVALLLSMASVGFIVWLVWQLVRALHSEYTTMSFGDTYNSRLYLFGFIAVSLSIVSIIYSGFGRRVSVLDLWMGAICWWALILIPVSLFLPGGSYLFTWPLIFSLLSLAIILVWDDLRSSTWKRLGILFLGSIPAIVLFSPLIHTFFVSLTIASSALVMVVAALPLGTLISQLNLAPGKKGWPLAVVSLVVGIGFLVSGSLTSRFDKSHPMQTNLFYALQADTEKAVWASSDNGPNKWTSQFFSSGWKTMDLPAFFPGRSWRFMTNDAPAISLPPPQLELLAENKSGAVRTLRLRATSPRSAPVISLYVEADADVRGVEINGKPIQTEIQEAQPGRSNRWSMRYYALPVGGIELILESKSTHTIRIKAVDMSYDLPSIPGAAFKTRPDDIIAAPLPLSDSTLVSKSFNF